jgi:integrase
MAVNPRGASFEVYVKRGERRWRLSAKTEAQGRAMEAEIAAALAAGREPDLEAIKEVSESGKKTLRQAVDLTIATKWRGTKSEAFATLNANLCARILGEGRPLDSISDDDIDTLVQTFQAQGNSDATINRKMSALRTVLDLAVRRKWIATAPELPHKKEGIGRIREFTAAEERAIISTTRSIGRDDEADLWAFLIDTGARVSEALGLTWQDVKAGRVTFVDTKNGMSRTVPLTSRLREMMERRSACEGGPFPMTYTNVRHAWDRVRVLLGKADDPLWIIHVLRHTCACRLVQRGVSLLVVKDWLGHKTVEMTLRYARLAPSNLDAAMLVLDRPAPVAEVADAVGLGPTAERHGGSSPSGRTTRPQLRIA